MRPPFIIAISILSLSTGALALPNASRIAVSSGAGAMKGRVALALNGLCTTGGGVMTEFSSGSNLSTYVCADTAVTSGAGGSYANKPNANFRNFSGTGFAELRLNTSGGSFAAVCALNNWPDHTDCGKVNAGGAPDTYRDPATAANVLRAPGQVMVGGLMDVESDTWPAWVTVGLAQPQALRMSGTAQSFGIAVTDKLYTAMFNAQKAASGGATMDRPIPSHCLVTDTTKLECVPTVSKGQMATVMADNEFNEAYLKGAGFLGGPALDGVQLEYNRRADTSGTQAASEVYFLGGPCSTTRLSSAASPPPGGSSVLEQIKVFAHRTIAEIFARLNNVDAYGIGVVSGVNNPTDAGTRWKWLRVQGAPLAENAKPSVGVGNTAAVRNGSYDFYFHTVAAESGAAGTFWSVVGAAMEALPASTGALNATDMAGYTKGGNTCQYNSR